MHWLQNSTRKLPYHRRLCMTLHMRVAGNTNNWGSAAHCSTTQSKFGRNSVGGKAWPGMCCAALTVFWSTYPVFVVYLRRSLASLGYSIPRVNVTTPHLTISQRTSLILLSITSRQCMAIGFFINSMLPNTVQWTFPGHASDGCA